MNNFFLLILKCSSMKLVGGPLLQTTWISNFKNVCINKYNDIHTYNLLLSLQRSYLTLKVVRFNYLVNRAHTFVTDCLIPY